MRAAGEEEGGAERSSSRRRRRRPAGSEGDGDGEGDGWRKGASPGEKAREWGEREEAEKREGQEEEEMETGKVPSGRAHRPRGQARIGVRGERAEGGETGQPPVAAGSRLRGPAAPPPNARAGSRRASSSGQTCKESQARAGAPCASSPGSRCLSACADPERPGTSWTSGAGPVRRQLPCPCRCSASSSGGLEGSSPGAESVSETTSGWVPPTARAGLAREPEDGTSAVGSWQSSTSN